MTHIGKIEDLKLESHLRNAFRIASKHFTYKTVIIIMEKLNNLLVKYFQRKRKLFNVGYEETDYLTDR
jgi:hypothetical protein